jgi:hypothetical protein
MFVSLASSICSTTSTDSFKNVSRGESIQPKSFSRLQIPLPLSITKRPFKVMVGWG